MIFKQDHSLHNLSQYLEALIIRIESGQGFQQALKDAPQIFLDRHWIEKWIPLRDKILAGSGACLESLQSFHKSITLQQKLERLVKKKSFLPVLQAISVMGISIVMIIFSQLLAPNIFVLKNFELFFLVLWLGLGVFWTLAILKESKKNLWISNWITFIDNIESRIGWGQNFLSAWQESQPLEKHLPDELRAFLRASFSKAQKYEEFSVFEVKFSKQLSIRKSQERWLQIHRLFVQNERIRCLFKNEALSAYNSLEDSLELSADKVSAKLLLPLFIFFMPASVSVILMPLLRIISGEF